MAHYTPVDDDVRKRRSRKHRLYHDQCVWISVIELAKRGFFRPVLHRGEAELLSEEFSDWCLTAPITTTMRQDDGVLSIDVDDPTRPVRGLLTVCWPHTTDVRLHRVDTPPAGHKWYFVCPGTWS